MKRTLDLFVASVGLVLLLPLLGITAIGVRLLVGSPVLFRQIRPGLGARPFTLVKFRTMRDAYDPDGHPLADSERLTRFGTLLRRTSLDELPELWNVVRGDMSLVGPRPLLMEYVPRYSPAQARRHEVRPGITGWAQVNGRNALGWEDRLRLDVWYVDNRSFALDLKILLLTLKKVLTKEGISSPGEATMAKFRGSEGASLTAADGSVDSPYAS
jgi:lipopolysaccharide/colanic/teichoic acid biosynthesis glycosyltransferase